MEPAATARGRSTLRADERFVIGSGASGDWQPPDGLACDPVPWGGSGHREQVLDFGVPPAAYAAPAVTVRADSAHSGAMAPEASAASRAGQRRRFTRMPWPMLAVLAAQAGLSIRLLWVNTAFMDEGQYLWTGHLEITHLLYHVPIPQAQEFLSGAPVLYPIIGAIADSYGGLTAARLLSLVFMLAATTLLYLTTSRLFGRRAGVAAAAVFAALGPVQALGVFATYDPMAIFLLALSAWLTVRARGRAAELLLLAAALVMALADATKYAAGLWDPVIISLAALTSGQRAFWSVLRGLRMTVYVAAPLLAALFRLGGPAYIHGVMVTTVDRQLGDDTASVASVAHVTSSLIGVLLIFGVVAFLVSFTDTVRTRLLCGVLVFGGLLAPLHQAQIHVLTSLPKHLAFGAWFCAIAVGYLLARTAGEWQPKGWRVGVGAAAIIAAIGIPQAGAFFQVWPSSARMIPVMRSLVRDAGCPCLVTQEYVVYYYLATLVRPGELTGPFYYAAFDNQSHREIIGTPAYQWAIRNHYFHVVEIDPAESPSLAAPVETTLATTAGYRLAAIIPIPGWDGGRTELWVYQPRGHRSSRRLRASPP